MIVRAEGGLSKDLRIDSREALGFIFGWCAEDAWLPVSSFVFFIERPNVFEAIVESNELAPTVEKVQCYDKGDG